MTQTHDIAIIGGGLAGLTLAATLAAKAIPCVLIDNNPPPQTLAAPFDGRTTAISYGSRHLLKEAGLWDALADKACPIKTIDIMDEGSATLLQFRDEEVEGNPFGWIVENRDFRAALLEAVTTSPHVEFIAPDSVKDFTVTKDYVEIHLENNSPIHSRLVVGADGRNSFTRRWMDIPVRQWTYQTALVFVATHSRPHNNTAIEHFKTDGPFAVLPMPDGEGGEHRSSVVWSLDDEQHALFKACDEAIFNTALTVRFPEFYGDVSLASARFSYPLSLCHAYAYIGPRMALMAEAAHGIHPIAGQGLNMSFRDIAALAALVEGATDPGAPEVLEDYQTRRRADNILMAGGTDVLNNLFGVSLESVGAVRRLGIRAVAAVKPAKNFFMRQAMGQSPLSPRLIREGKW